MSKIWFVITFLAVVGGTLTYYSVVGFDHNDDVKVDFQAYSAAVPDEIKQEARKY